MTKSDKQYKGQLKQLRQYFNFSFDARNKMTPARKAAITRAAKRYQRDIKPALDRGAKFQKAGTRTRRSVKQLAGQRAVTPKGYFLTPPKGAESIKFDPKQNAIISKVGAYTFKTYDLTDPVQFAINPESVLRGLPEYRKADFVRVNVAPGQYLGNNQFTKDQINKYITNDLPGNQENPPKYPDKNTHNPAEFITGVTLVFEE